MAKIICPYCCHKFEPSKMVFKLEESLENKSAVDEAIDEVTGGLSWDDSWEDHQAVADEKLVNYYKNIEKEDGPTAEMFARDTNPYGCVEIDISALGHRASNYNDKFLKEHHFIMKLDYEDENGVVHHLKQRVCPECHNHLPQYAGLYEMKMIAMFGNTSVGKTVYLDVLQAVLRGDRRIVDGGYAFEGDMTFIGFERQEETHEKEYRALLEDGKLPVATNKDKIDPPQIYKYSYKTAENMNEEKNVIIVFRDIPGEAVITDEKLERYEFYLKNSDGYIVMLDASWLGVSVPYLHPGHALDGENDPKRSLENLKSLLVHIYGDKKIDIPAAIVLAKADLLKKVDAIEETREFQEVMYIENSNELHQSYLDKKIIQQLDRNITELLEDKIGEKRLTNKIKESFTEYSYFCISALGDAPMKIEDEFFTETAQRIPQIRPHRVAEPFYWLMAKLDCIPYRVYAKYEQERGFLRRTREQCEVTTYYLESEIKGGKAKEKHNQQLKNKGFNLDRTRCIKMSNSF